MPLPKTTSSALIAAGISLREDEPLLRRTWWRAGGSADGWAEVGDTATLQRVQRICAQTGCPVFVLGNASNLLVSDRGVRGLVIRLGGGLSTSSLQPDGLTLRVGAGLKLIALLRRMARAEWTGLEFLAGVPGTVGGAIRMNAGTRLGQVSDRLLHAGVVERDGSVRVISRRDLHMAYRSCALPPGAVVAYGTFRIGGLSLARSLALIEAHLAYRAQTQPVDKPTCGSTFRNPEGDSAGRLIEASGLKGRHIGGARVSPKHANFIENTGGATAADIRRLIEHVQAEVWERQGVMLEPEVHFAGDWSHWDPDATL